jgi:hypothetical protein
VTSTGLQVVFAKHLNVLLQVDCVRVNSRLVIFNFLIHQAEVQVNRGDFGMIVTSNQTQNQQCSVHVSEAHTEVATVVVIHG